MGRFGGMGCIVAWATLLELSWTRAWVGLGASGDGHVLRDAVLSHYDHPRRSFHTRQHLRECLGSFNIVAPTARHPAEVEMAIWFHDAVHDPMASDNKERSAEWARAVLTKAGVPSFSVERVCRYVMTTADPSSAAEHDQHLVADLDNAVFAAKPDRYVEHEHQLRMEASHLSDAAYAKSRRAQITAHLRRQVIYATPVLHASFESRARTNLTQSLARLN